MPKSRTCWPEKSAAHCKFLSHERVREKTAVARVPTSKHKHGLGSVIEQIVSTQRKKLEIAGSKDEVRAMDEEIVELAGEVPLGEMV